MSPATLRVVLLVSCAHALVHVYELTFPSVEQLVAAQYHVGQEVTGLLGNCWRLPFGLFAMPAGWLADRYGSKPLLVIYLAGCAATSALAGTESSLGLLFVSLFAMGMFAGIYHPAGLALISHETEPQYRTLALGYHGIMGSAGIAAAPLAAGLFLAWGFRWQQYYLLLVVPGAVLALVIARSLKETHRASAATRASPRPTDSSWRGPFLLLTAIGALFGFIYAAVLNFLPRYLGQVDLLAGTVSPEGMRNYLTSGVLLIGIVGQYVAGRFVHPQRLERALALVLVANAPCLAWMAVAQGSARIVAAGSFALVHFMHQPIYNSLVAKYVPAARRSLGFGFSNTMSFGVGSLGAGAAGITRAQWGEEATYLALAGLAVAAAALAAVLLRGGRPRAAA